jgi:hypothetical protein
VIRARPRSCCANPEQEHADQASRSHCWRVSRS